MWGKQEEVFQVNSFVASNGVELDKRGYVISKKPWDGEGVIHEARKEFYQNLRDKELGQTREGNMIVRPLSDDEVLVLDETTSRSAVWHRHENPEFNGAFGREEAKRYFAANPKPELWHSAVEGDLWEVDYLGIDYIALVSVNAEFIFTDKLSVPITDKDITYGTRLWPNLEGDSDE